MRLHTLAAAAISLPLVAVVHLSSASANDLGAGPIAMRITPCLIAKASGQQPCKEPILPETNDAAARIEAHLTRAWFFIDLQQLKEAVSEVDAALMLDTNDAAARHMSARLALANRDIVRAERDIAIARRQAPSDPDIRATHAELIEIRYDAREAFREFNQILGGHPNHKYSRMKRARLMLETGLVREALYDLNFLIAADELNVAFLSMRGRAHLDVENSKEAAADFTAALVVQPRDFTLLASRARAYEQSGLDAAALLDYEAILGPVGGRPNYALGGPDVADFLRRRSNVFVRIGRFDDAAADAIAALTVGGKQAILQTQIFLRRNGFADVPLDGGDSDKLRNALRICLGLNACFQAISKPL